MDSTNFLNKKCSTKKKLYKYNKYYNKNFNYFENNTGSVSNLALLSSIEVLNSLIIRYSNIIDNLNSLNIIVQIYIYRDNLIYGYIGNKYYLSENVFGLKRIKDITANIRNRAKINNNINNFKNNNKINTHDYLKVLLTNDVYSDLNPELQQLCFPFNIQSENILYKVFTNDNLKGSESHLSLYYKDFSLQRIYIIKNQIHEILNVSVDMLIDYFISTDHVAKGVCVTTKSLTKLAMYHISVNDYSKAYLVIIDIEKMLYNSKKKGIKDICFNIRIKEIKYELLNRINNM